MRCPSLMLSPSYAIHHEQVYITGTDNGISGQFLV